ncbi:hypothetical protein KIL84_017627 [Mauremys mutica]|uniref:Uncharacterized protein n=1 Tax=Mauremys mutica TaxID=74926 RepID=A0A9D4AX22_9SAUR|nr:hypothetical protein KIL84_017627 [Mauremys mutica]
MLARAGFYPRSTLHETGQQPGPFSSQHVEQLIQPSKRVRLNNTLELLCISCCRQHTCHASTCQGLALLIKKRVGVCGCDSANPNLNRQIAIILAIIISAFEPSPTVLGSQPFC